jgi:hypothetical protein
MEHPIIITSTNQIGFEEKIRGRSAGRQAIAQSMASSIRRNLDYNGLARKVLTVTSLPRDEEDV